jgi:hypothetical protein
VTVKNENSVPTDGCIDSPLHAFEPERLGVFARAL